MSSDGHETQQTKRELTHDETNPSTEDVDHQTKKPRRSRWGDASTASNESVIIPSHSIVPPSAPQPSQTPVVPTGSSNVQAALERARALALRVQAGNTAAITTSTTVPPSATTSSTQSIHSLPVPKPATVIHTRFDTFGRALDEHGNVINEPTQTEKSTFKLTSQQPKATTDAVEAAQSKASLLKQRIQEEKQQRSLFIDPNIHTTKKKKGLFTMVQPGTYMKQAANMRLRQAAQEALKKSEEQIAAIERQDGRLIDWNGAVWGGQGVHVPNVLKKGCEWWDDTILKTGSNGPSYHHHHEANVKAEDNGNVDSNSTSSNQDQLAKNSLPLEAIMEYLHSQQQQQQQQQQLQQQQQQESDSMSDTVVTQPVEWPCASTISPSIITAYIHHPRYLAPIQPPSLDKPIELMLTKEERRKARRLRRMEAHREQQDLIVAGVIPAPEPKIKLSNLARVLGSGMVSDPTALEAKARKQIDARRDEHIQRNLDNMLTPQQRAEKTKKKYQEDEKAAVHVAVYRCGSLANNKKKFQVIKNAQKFNLTGIGMMNKQCNVVVVEGGPKGLKKYKAVMMRRIKWGGAKTPSTDDANDDDDDQEEEDDANQDVEPENENDKGYSVHKDCVCVWEGSLPKRVFKNFRLEAAESKIIAREMMMSQGVGQYWDLSQSHL